MAVSHVKNLTMGDTSDTTVVRPSDWNSVHNQYYTLAGNTAGASTVSGTNIVWQGGNRATLSVNGSTIVVSVNVGTRSYNIPYLGSYGLVSLGTKTIFIQPAQLDGGDYIFDRALHYVSVSQNSAVASSISAVLSVYVGLYTKNGSTLSLATSGSQSYGWSATSGTGTTNQSGIRQVSIPLAATVTWGDYWLAFMYNSATTGNNVATVTNLVYSQVASTFAGQFGVAANASMQSVLGYGQYSATSASLPGSMAFSDIRDASSALVKQPVIYFGNGTA